MKQREDDNFDVQLLNDISPTDEPLHLHEMCTGYSRYMRVKALLEEKYNMKINHDQMGMIFSEVLKEMPHEKRVQKRYGQGKRYCRIAGK